MKAITSTIDVIGAPLTADLVACCDRIMKDLQEKIENHMKVLGFSYDSLSIDTSITHSTEYVIIYITNIKNRFTNEVIKGFEFIRMPFDETDDIIAKLVLELTSGKYMIFEPVWKDVDNVMFNGWNKEKKGKK